jgi:hypothetical protein
LDIYFFYGFENLITTVSVILRHLEAEQKFVYPPLKFVSGRNPVEDILGGVMALLRGFH